MTSQPQTFKPILGEHPHGGKTAYVFFQDIYFRPCAEDSASRAVYVELDGHGTVVHSMVLLGC